MSSSLNSSPCKGVRSFCSKWTFKVDLRLDTAGREEGREGVRASKKKTTVSSIPIVFIMSIPIHFSVQLLLQHKWTVAEGIQLKPLRPDRWLPGGVTLCPWMSIGSKSSENPGCDLHTLLWLKLSGINGFLQTRLVILRLTIDTLPTLLCLQCLCILRKKKPTWID